MTDEDGRCPNCGEDEMDGARCYYCGYHDYNCGMQDCSWCDERHAQAIEARRAATLGAVHESAIRQDTPELSQGGQDA